MFALWGAVSKRVAAGLRAGVVSLALAINLAPPRACAESEAPRNEFFTGFEASDNYASAYLGGGYAFGKGLYAPGWRLRSVASYGRYRYDSTLPVGVDNVAIEVDGEEYFGSALVGYQFHPGGRLIVRLFAGIESDSQIISPHDPNNSVQGSALGLRLQAETWTNLSERYFLSADASYGTAFQEYWALARLGLRLGERVSLGLEGGALGNEEYNAGRGGGFARVNFRAMEVTLSSGFTGNYLEDDPSFYVALGLYRPF